ncbi:MAG: type II toxin-antitoxin system Phd/YefM family antitoxin [Acidimicrobiales bacterium]
MSTVSVRDLAHGASRVIEEVRNSGRPAVITKRGRAVAAIVPIDEEALEDWVLANAPEFVANMAEAEAEIAAGVKGVPLEEAFAALGDDEAFDALVERSSFPETPVDDEG